VFDTFTSETKNLSSFDIPVYKLNNQVFYFTNEIILQAKKDVDFNKILDLVNSKVTVKQFKYNNYVLSIDKGINVFDIANLIYESNLVDWCHPNFKADIVQTVTPADPLFINQYYLNNTGQFNGTVGIDINAPEAWDITKGCDVRVVVIDDGLENHEDMDTRILLGFTPVNNGNGSPIAQCVNNSRVGHGIACAGIIGASHNNIGISGIAPNSNLIPVNIFAGGETALDIATGINWSWDPSGGNADVISNSWGYTTTVNVSDAIVQSINNARTFGRVRNGVALGSIVVFASGNENQNFNGVTFPANVNGVVTVGAIDNQGNIQNYSSRGNEMNLVAPSGGSGAQQTYQSCIIPSGDIVTTDRMGTFGYTDNNYTTTFNGTSAACPQVSGVVALMLSVNPNLTENQVRNILNTTATDMGTPGFDNTFGFGRLNAFAAVNAAAPQIQGPPQFCNTETYTIQNLPAGATVNWTVSPSYLVTTTTSGNSITLTKAYNGNIVLSATVSSACGDINLNSLPIKAGTPVFDIPSFTNSENGMPFWCSNATGNSFTIENTNHTGVYEARLLNYPSLTVFATNNNAFPGSDVFGYVPAGYYVFQIRATNNCGTSDWIETEVESTDCSNNFRISSNYTLYPNPANDEITIEYTALQEGENLSKPLQQKDVKLYNQKGEILLSSLWKENEQKLRLETKNVPDGTYYLHITEGKETIKKQIIIKH
jgi:subtilisin family serine protease